MKVVQINTFPYKATGNIMMSIHDELLNCGIESYVVWGRGRSAQNKNEIVLHDDLGVKIHGIYTRLTDKTGFASRRITKKLVNRLIEIDPDIVHLHNIHGYYINIEILFKYLKKNNKKVIWTFHDCWPLTGHCAYFDMVGCEKWKTGCYKCPQVKTYPASFGIDRSSWNWKKKQELFSIDNLTVVVPCNWLNQIVKASPLGFNDIETIYNGIDTNKYYHVESKIQEKFKIKDKRIILGVASEWTQRKGLQDFIELSKHLDHNKYKIILVGLTKKQISMLPKEIIGLQRTSNLYELLELYSGAWVFFNPTYEDNFPTTNLEAIACETPVISYRTGGSPEAVSDQNGIVIDKGDINAAIYAIENIEKINITPKLSDVFKKENMIKSYIDIYKKSIQIN